MIKFRRVKESDIINIKKLFFLTFNKKISTTYYKQRYLNNRNSYDAFIAFYNNKIIGHVGFRKIKTYALNNKLMYFYSRHSSMIHYSFRRQGIYNLLCNYAFNFLRKKKNILGLIIWPNSNNIKVKINNYIPLLFNDHFIYSKLPVRKQKKTYKKNIFYNFNELQDKIFPNKKNFIFKDSSYFKSTYFLDNNNFYLFSLNENYIIFNFDLNTKKNINILEYSDNRLFNTLLDEFIKEFKNYKINIWSSHKDNRKYNILKNKGFILNKRNKFKIGFIPFNKYKVYNKLINDTFFNMGDTDVFHKTN